MDSSIPSYKPFKLEIKNAALPVCFDIEFVAESLRYAYSIEFFEKDVLKEELYFFPEGRKANLFKRDNLNNVKFGSYFTGEKKSLETFLLPNRLMLSVAANSKNEILRPVIRFFRDVINIHVRMDSSQKPFHSTTLELRDRKEEFKNLLFKILQAADLSVRDIKLIEDKEIDSKIKIPENIPDDLKQSIIDDFRFRPYLGHPIFNDGIVTDNIEYFNLEKEESTGTIKMYDIAGEVLNALQSGTVLIIDEFNSGLHPLLNKFLVELFIDPNINKKNAQLLISTHDTCVLDLNILKREQIWFTELFSLDEFDKNLIRDYSKYGKLYLDGRFLAVPSPSTAALVDGVF